MKALRNPSRQHLFPLVLELSLSFLISAFFFLPVGARAADTGSVTATVTLQNVSVSVTDGTVTYGTLGLNSSEDTTSGGINDSQTATNNGNVAVDLNIRGANSTDWTLGSSAGNNTYRHRFCTSNCDVSPTWTDLTTNYNTLATNVAASGTQVFDLEITTPTTSSVYTEQSVNVTVQAVLAQ